MTRLKLLIKLGIWASVLSVVLLACTIRQELYRLKQEWNQVRAEVVTRHAAKQLSEQEMQSFLEADKNFRQKHNSAVDKHIAGLDVPVDDYDYMVELLEAWKGKYK